MKILTLEPMRSTIINDVYVLNQSDKEKITIHTDGVSLIIFRR